MLFFGCCIRGRVSGVNAGDDNVVFVPGMKAALAQGRRHASEHLRAEHLAVVIHQRQHDGAIVVEVVAELYLTAGFISKDVAEGQRPVEILLDASVLLPRRRLLRRCANGTISRVLGTRGYRSERGKSDEAESGAAKDHITEYAAGLILRVAGAGARFFRCARTGGPRRGFA